MNIIMKYLNVSIEDLKSSRGFHTAKEICSQPDLWGKSYLKLLEEKDQIFEFLEKVLKNNYLSVVLAGAGSSAFIGEALVGYFQKNGRFHVGQLVQQILLLILRIISLNPGQPY